ncbi:MAG: acetyl-CoA carboxylase biotin carboxylase subunit family protein [Candidatus Kapaibacterium sp.]
MSRLLAFGAGPEREGFINEAAVAGHEVHVIHNDINPSGIDRAFKAYRCDLLDHCAIEQLVKDIQPGGIIPTPLGKTLLTSGRINEKFNLRGIKSKAADVCTDKSKMSHIMNLCGISYPRQIMAETKDDIFNAAQKIDFPLILKPVKGSGSKGVGYIDNPKSLNALTNEHLKLRGNDATLVQSFIDGDEYGLDAVINEGEIEILLVRKKLLTPLPDRLIEGYIAPAAVSAGIKMKIEQALRLFTKTSGMDNCLIHADLIINDNNLFFLEISGRPAGIFLIDKFMPYCTGVNAVRQSIKMVLGDPAYFGIKHNKFHAISYLPIKGVVKKIPPDSEIQKYPGIKEYIFYFKLNEKLDNMKNTAGIFRRGYAIFEGHDEYDILKKIDNFIKMIKT